MFIYIDLVYRPVIPMSNYFYYDDVDRLCIYKKNWIRFYFVLIHVPLFPTFKNAIPLRILCHRKIPANQTGTLILSCRLIHHHHNLFTSGRRK